VNNEVTLPLMSAAAAAAAATLHLPAYGFNLQEQLQDSGSCWWLLVVLQSVTSSTSMALAAQILRGPCRPCLMMGSAHSLIQCQPWVR
jgi:hypothetical protein